MTKVEMRFLLCTMLSIWTGESWTITSEHAPGKITFLRNSIAI